MKNSNSLDTARNILEKALEKSFLPFSGQPIIRLRKAAWEDDEYVLELKLPEHKDWEGLPIGGTLSSKDADERVTWWNNIGREINEALVRREEKKKEEFIKALDIEKLIKLIREA